MELWKDYEGQKKRLEEAERLIHSVKSDLEKASQSYNAKLAQIEEGEREGEVLNAELALLPQVEKDLQASEQSFRELKGKLEEEKRRLWEAEERIRNCQELESKRRQREEEMNQLAVEEKVYEELAEAFGKRGIQALLIEQALPQLFEEADGLLKRLTNDRMSLNFKTERLTKEGKIIETLEIIISDELGTRSYEMYSGGETFRIDFALRVALARLVAKRAGVPLSTLIIDEGFGSQDTIGRENLVEAINTVARDFDKVLVVTHIDEIKERFPVRIEVTKTEEGSVFRII
jgi:exonuclease SbcC